MKDYERYGIAVEQVYEPADGSTNRLTVRDVKTYEDCGDVVVFDEALQIERRIDAFKLAKARYSLLPAANQVPRPQGNFMTLSVGQHVIAPLLFNAVCGTVESVDADGGLTLVNAFDIFGPLERRVRVSTATAKPFPELPRLLGIKDMVALRD